MYDEFRIFLRGDEVPGITAYAFWADDAAPAVEPPRECWPPGTEFDDFWLHGDVKGAAWRVLCRAVAVPCWPSPDEWETSVRGSMDVCLRAGAQVAWCAVEGCFVDPPDLLKPEFMGGCVWAACAPNFGCRVATLPSGPYQGLTEDELRKLALIVEQSLSPGDIA